MSGEVSAKSELFSAESAIHNAVKTAGSLMSVNLGIAETQVDIGDGITIPAGAFCAKQIEGMLLVLADLPSTDRQLLSDWLGK